MEALLPSPCPSILLDLTAETVSQCSLVTVRRLRARLSTWNQDIAQYNGFLLVSAGQTNDIGEVRKMAY